MKIDPSWDWRSKGSMHLLFSFYHLLSDSEIEADKRISGFAFFMNCSKFSFLPVWNLPISISHIEFQLNTRCSQVRWSINFFSFTKLESEHSVQLEEGIDNQKEKGKLKAKAHVRLPIHNPHHHTWSCHVCLLHFQSTKNYYLYQ